jgi:hypothetical protein
MIEWCPDITSFDDSLNTWHYRFSYSRSRNRVYTSCRALTLCSLNVQHTPGRLYHDVQYTEQIPLGLLTLDEKISKNNKKKDFYSQMLLFELHCMTCMSEKFSNTNCKIQYSDFLVVQCIWCYIFSQASV